ncbi:MAG: amidase family protein [Betaproteobacteria bacterium]|nr:amidase family protein [Betaproteobacteria bacterium]
MSDELWKWSATELARAIRDRDISAREATQSALERVHSVNPKLNAIVDLMAEEALAAADGADAAAGRGELFGPLHGVPVTLKINVDVAGRATTNGVVAFKDRIARDDSPVVASWRRAGAIFIGRTNVPAFSTRYFTDCELHGRTLNPWDPRRTPGGSSGGAAACVATGMGAIAHGNDRAGSVRYPAYACGVFGIRPTLGRVPTFEGTSPEEIAITTQLCHTQGVLARTVDDLRLGLETTIAGDPRDPWSVSVPLRNDGLSPGRIALSMQKAAPEVQAALRHAAKWLEDAGYRVEEAEPPRLEEAGRLFFTLVVSEGMASKEDRAGTSRAIEAYGDEPAKRARRSTVASLMPLDYAGYINAFARRAAILRQWMVFFERYQALLLPVSRERPFAVDEDQRGDAAMAMLLEAQVPMLAASTLGLPGLTVPATLADGVPVGVQLIGRRYGEELLLAAARAIEERTGVRTPIEPRH